MRIRSIKPEFWRSDDISALEVWDRLLFIGLWSYVDDNGVGRDQEALIAADLFAHDLSVDPTETLRRVSQGLNRLYSASLIARYTAPHNGQRRDFLEVTNWKRHQRIQNPGQPRYPRSDADEATPTETLHSPSVDATETLRPGAGDQGAGEQGIREQGSSEPNGSGGQAAAASTDGADNAQALIAEWIDNCSERPPGRVIGQLSKEIKALLTEGQDYQQVRAAVQAWNTKGTHPSVLPSVLHELRNKKTQPRLSAADRAMQRGAERHQQIENGQLGQSISWDDVFTANQIER